MFELLYFARVSAQPLTTQTPVLLYVVGALLAGGGLAFLSQLIRHWRRGQVEDTELISRITKDTISGAKDILAEYRLEVELVKRQVETYRVQLNDLMEKLAEANFRIRKLEESLREAHEDRDKLIKELEVTIEQRTQLLTEIERLRRQISKMVNGDDTPEEAAG